MIRSILAIVTGYLAMVIIVVVGTILAVRILLRRPLAEMRQSASAPPPARYVAANLVASAIAAIVGGFVTATIAVDHRIRHGVALAVVMLLMSVVSTRRAGTAQPRWYQFTIMAVMPLLALAGAAIE
jgi:hypothetical protein